MNELKKKLGLDWHVDRSACDFEKHPTVRNLSLIKKRDQTREMIRLAMDHYDGKPLFPWRYRQQYTESILKNSSRRLLDEELCMEACAKSAVDLRYVPKKYLTRDLCMIAVAANGDALEFVPQEMRDYEMCYTAVSNDHTHRGLAMANVPDRLKRGKRGKRLCMRAVETDGMAVRYVPQEYVTAEIAEAVVANSWPGEFRECSEEYRMMSGEEGAESCPKEVYIEARDWPIGHLPANVMTQQLAQLSVDLHPKSFPSVPDEYKSHDMCLAALDTSWQFLKDVPAPINEQDDIIDKALGISPLALQYVPEKCRTSERCLEAKAADPDGVNTKCFPGTVRAQWAAQHSPSIGRLVSSAEQLVLPAVPEPGELPVRYTACPICREIDDLDASAVNFYYISDVHLEHQLDLRGLNLEEARARINAKVAELSCSIQAENYARSVILVAGDIADSLALTRVFYEELEKAVPLVPIVGVLGNHEIWCLDDDPERERSVDDIIGGYVAACSEVAGSPFAGMRRCAILENSLYVIHKGTNAVIIDEKTLLGCEEEDLAEVISESSFCILGGVGFSGKNPLFNASDGLYRGRLSREEEIKRSSRFRSAYEKVGRCSSGKRIVVLTHMPSRDWSMGPLRAGWVYVNGHTHRNAMRAEGNGALSLSDCQMGYAPRPWHFNQFRFDGLYDPFSSWPSGQYEISGQQYADFYRGRSAMMRFSERTGKLLMLKCSGVYMFLYQGDKLYLLEGGRKHVLEHDYGWYYVHLPEYVDRVKSAFAPFEKALDMLSHDIRTIGGAGTVHGCIVDIDWSHHVYLNPYDGTVTPYFATDMTNKVMYRSFRDLIENSPALADSTVMLLRLEKSAKGGLVPYLSALANGGNERLAHDSKVSEIVLDKTMYRASRAIRSVQYVFDHGIVRIWRDEILDMADPDMRIGDMQSVQ